MNDHLLSVEHLNFKYEDTEVLNDINFTVSRGDYLGIIGPNGSGKTTLVKLILGLLEPDSGVLNLDEQIQANYKVSYVSQQVYSHYKNFPITVFEVVRMGLYSSKGFFKFYNKQDHDLVLDMLKKLNIEHLKDKQMVNLSGGERQRALLGRSLMSNPELLILDEPTSALDPQFRHEFYELMSMINKQGVTVLLISHDLGVLDRYVNKILYLDSSVEYFGSQVDFKSSEAYQNRHGGLKDDSATN